MHRGNVLVIGNSGVGKSTLINAVLGEDRAVTGFGTKGTTESLSIYESGRIPFRIIDTIGFEPSWFKAQKAIGAVKKWSKLSTKAGHEDSQINVIWFCVEGTSSKLFPQTIKDLSRATSIWPSVPVVVVITKSYSVPDRANNIEMVHNAFAQQKRYTNNLKGVIPVVAQTYTLNDTSYAPPEGVTELIDKTNSLLPEGLQAAKEDIERYNLTRKRAFANSITGIATVSAVTVGAIPVPFSDALLLGPIEVVEINTLAHVYGIKNEESTKRFFNSIVEAGTVSIAAKGAISAVKAIPVVNVGASIVNAVVAGGIVVALGQVCTYAFEQIYLGEKTTDDIDWIRKMIESKLAGQFVEKITSILQEITENTDMKTIAAAIKTEFFQK